nr:hypothetical protein [Candidatus Prometheoarchaeum syntrophicum]
MSYVTYNCPTCQMRRQAGGTIPPLCPACGKVICHVCGEKDLCPTCYNYVTPEEMAYYDSVCNSAKQLKALVAVKPGLCCGITFLLLGITLIASPTGILEIGIILAILGGLLTLFLFPMNLMNDRKWKDYYKRKDDAFRSLVAKIKQRRMH